MELRYVKHMSAVEEQTSVHLASITWRVGLVLADLLDMANWMM